MKPLKLNRIATLVFVSWILICAEVYAEGVPDFNSKLTGDWGGARTKLAEKGITLDIDVLQSYQGILNGGKRGQWKYGGSVDYRLKLDFEKLGLWPGAYLDIQAENQFGEFINSDVGTIMFTNTDGMFPLPNYQKVNVSEFKFTQFFSESFAVFLGKINMVDGDDNIFAGSRGKTNFMHQNFVVNPVGLTTVPYSTLGAGAVFFLPNVMAKDHAVLSFMVIGPEGQPNTIGFNRDFKNGETFVFAYRQPTRFFGQSGSHTFSGSYGTKDYMLLEQNPRLILEALRGFPVTFAEKEDSWSFMYNMHQYIYTEKEDETQGFGIFGRFGAADDKTNPIEAFYSIGLGGKGMFQGRDNDTYGIGYFYAQLSDKFGKIIERNFGDTQGFEMFYNFELSKWLHVTPDFQVIKPSAKNVDTAYIVGVRVKMDF
jgi:porin